MTLKSNIVDAEPVIMEQRMKGLIASAQQGDRAAYQQIYQQHIGQVYALCYRLTGDKDHAEEAAQEVFIQVWQKLDNFKGDSKFSTWLHSVTSNVAISYLRKQKGWLQKMFNLEDSAVADMPSEGLTGEIDLDAIIIRLPERARIVFVLHAIEGYRHEEIAQRMNIAVGSSKAQFHRAKQLMKDWMGYE
ncbi:RNA polymerase sigma factor [Planctobacterium marinum]